MESAAARTGWSRRWDAAAVCLAAVATAARCLAWPHVFSDGMVVPLGVDPYYHLRRALLLADQLPASPQVDEFLSFPAGAPIPWPPGFDLLVAVPALWGAGPEAVAAWGSALVPVLGGLAVFLTFRLGARVFGPAVGLLGAGVLAVMPGAVQTALVGRVDHHALVAPVSLGMLLCFLAATRAPTARRAALFGIASGALAATAVGSWIVTPPLYFLPVPVTAIALGLLGRAAPARVAIHATLASAAVLVLLVVLAVADLAARPFSLYQPSLLPVTLFALAAGVATIAVERPRWLAPLLALGAGVAGAALATLPSLRAPIADALSVAARNDASYLTAWESYPLLFHGEIFTLTRAALQYGPLIWLMPVLAAAFAVTVWRRRRGDAAAVLLAVFGVWGTALLFFQQRFGEYAAPAVALLSAWALVAAAAWIEAAARRRNLPRLARRAAVAGAAALAWAPLFAGLHALAADDPVAHQRGLLRFGRDLGQAVGAAAASGAPADGVLTSWMDAHPLLFASGLPVAASSFATPEARRGNERAFRLLLGSDADSAARSMREIGLRYVVVSPVLESVDAMAAIAGFEEPFVQRERAVDDTGRPYERYRPLLPFARSLHTRLLLADGSEIRIHGFPSPPVGRFRLLLESDVPVVLFGGRVPRYKAFEVVSGAHIRGEADPGQAVHLELDVETNIGRRFRYVRTTAADTTGRFELVVPYATERAVGATRALGPYRVHVGERLEPVRVSESQVQGGGTVIAGGSGPRSLAAAGRSDRPAP